MQSTAQIRTHGDVVVMDVRRCGALGLFEAYQDFAVQCVSRGVHRALLKTGGQDAQAHYALVDVLRMIVLVAGIPLDLRLAIVAGGAEPVVPVEQAMRDELRGLGCDSRIFRTVAEADDWLTPTPAAAAAPPADAGTARG